MPKKTAAVLRQSYAQTANHRDNFRCSAAVFEPGEDEISTAMRKVVGGGQFPIFLAVRLVSLSQVNSNDLLPAR